MKIAAITLMAAMVGVAAEPRQPQQRLTLYLVYDGLGSLAVRAPAFDLASKMFATIGIRLDWRRGDPLRTSSTRPIVIKLATCTPAKLHPGALGYSMPYEGIHIIVFYDRIERETVPSLTTVVLAHVLVHEIAHVLQRISHHSANGIMKAVWTDQDYRQMRVGALPFTPEDVELIHLGMASRASGPTLAARDQQQAGARGNEITAHQSGYGE